MLVFMGMLMDEAELEEELEEDDEDDEEDAAAPYTSY